MIPHKFPGVQVDLNPVEVIWLHYTRFFMEIEKEYESKIHVFKEPTGIYYKLTGLYSQQLLEEAKEKTYKYRDKNRIELLNISLDHQIYQEICQELRQQYKQIYLQLLHYNVFDYLSKKLATKFKYKQSIDEFQKIYKKNQKFCYLICDKNYFKQVEQSFYTQVDVCGRKRGMHFGEESKVQVNNTAGNQQSSGNNNYQNSKEDGNNKINIQQFEHDFPTLDNQINSQNDLINNNSDNKSLKLNKQDSSNSLEISFYSSSYSKIILDEDFSFSNIQLSPDQQLKSNQYISTFITNYQSMQYCLKRICNITNDQINIWLKTIQENQYYAAPCLIECYGKLLIAIDEDFFYDLYILYGKKSMNLRQALAQKLYPRLEDKINLIYEISVALYQLHSFNKEHGNLKLENILLNQSKNIILSDFGQAYFNELSRYLAPEKRMSLESDVWSLGLIIYFIFTGEELDTQKALALIEDDALINRIYVPQNSQIQTILYIIEKSLQIESANRIPVKKIIKKIKALMQGEDQDVY